MANRSRLLLTAAVFAMLAAPLSGWAADEPVATAPIPPPLPPAPIPAPARPPATPTASAKRPIVHRTAQVKQRAKRVVARHVVQHKKPASPPVVVHNEKPATPAVVTHNAAPQPPAEPKIRRRYYAAVLPPWYGYYAWRRPVMLPW